MSEVELIDIFADNLRDIMQEVGITQSELADESGLSRATINIDIAKQTLPTLKALINICYVLDCNLDELIPTYDQIR